MEKEILSVIHDKIAMTIQSPIAAKEIDDLTRNHYMDFVEWVGNKCKPVMVGHFNSHTNKYETNKFWEILGEDGCHQTEIIYKYWIEDKY